MKVSAAATPRRGAEIEGSVADRLPLITTRRSRATGMLERGGPIALVRWLVLTVALALAPSAFSFKFDDDEQQRQQEAQARSQAIAEKLSVACRKSLKDRKIMVVVGETHGKGIAAIQSKYGPIFNIINARLKSLGLRTYTQEEIRRQIAQAEIDAYFRNDPDTALAASSKLGANFILRGLINATHGFNRVLGIDEVSVNMAFNLTAASGKPISSVTARSESYSGSDTLSMALTLVEEQAGEVVAKLYYDYCTLADAGTRK